MAKNIVLCFDGTWNKPGDEQVDDSQQVETNVRRFYESVTASSPHGTPQIAWYDQGVGTHWYDRVTGGVAGMGLDINIMEGYRQLAKHYEEGDAVYILGFSRGAYTARSLVGFVRNCGLITGELLDLKLGIAFGIYRTRDDGPDSKVAKFFRQRFAQEIPIKFVGVWDTVGALGIPLKLFQDVNTKLYEFHDTHLSGIVENAFHAVAVDEHRGLYDVCLWDPEQPRSRRLEQRWFVGAHSDVGGGYADRALSDIALRWMQDRAQEVGLGLNPARLPTIQERNIQGRLHDSYGEFLRGLYAKQFPRHYRIIGQTALGNEVIDESVVARQQRLGEYQPQNPGLR